MLLVLGGGVFGAVKLVRARREARAVTKTEDKRPKRPPHRIVVGVTDSATADAGFIANDGATPGVASRFTQAGLDVEVRPIRGFKERLSAVESGDVDVMLGTLDHLAQVAPSFRAHGTPLRAFLLAGFSHGSLGVAVAGRPRGIEALKDARIATVKNSPAHYFLSALVRRSSLAPEEQEKLLANLVFVSRSAVAVDQLKHGEVTAAAVAEPHLSEALAGGKARLLASTRAATRLCPEVLFARESFLEDRSNDVQTFVRTWLEGATAADAEPAQAAQAVARALQQPVDEARAALGEVRLARFADQRAFFGLAGATSQFAPLFAEAGAFWRAQHVIDQPVDPAPVPWLHALEALAPAHASEAAPLDAPLKARGNPPALLTRTASIHFEPGEAELDAEARRRIDEVVPLLVELGGAPVRVECNTDGAAHVPTYKISRLRCQSIVDYLVAEHGLPKSRFSVAGNGAEKPVASDETPDGRERNRRTEFVFLSPQPD
jgi:ABC-type nitrate/sulfonate/bicarbonate transport system substrate-binding protein